MSGIYAFPFGQADCFLAELEEGDRPHIYSLTGGAGFGRELLSPIIWRKGEWISWI